MIKRVFVLSPWDETDPDSVRGAPDQAYLISGMLKQGWDVIRVVPTEFRLPSILRLIFFGTEIAFNTILIVCKGLYIARRTGRPNLVVCLDGKLAPGGLILSRLTMARFAKFQHGIKDYLARRNRLIGFLLNPDVPLNYWTGGFLFAVEDGSGSWELGKKRRNFIKLTQARPGHVPEAKKEKAFVFCGRLHRIKGADRFLRVARRVRELVPSAVCLVVGSGPLSPHFQKESWIELLGELPHREAIGQIARAKVLCATAAYGNFTLPVVEAMTCGTVPVAFRVCWTSHMIRDAGVLVAPFDEEAMAQEVARLLENDEFFREKSRMALNRAGELPTWKERTDEIIEKLEALCSRGF